MLYCLISSHVDDYEKIPPDHVVDVKNYHLFNEIMIFFGCHIPHVLIKEVVEIHSEKGCLYATHFFFEDRFYSNVSKRFPGVEILGPGALEGIIKRHDEIKNSSWFDQDTDRFELSVYAIGRDYWIIYAGKLDGILTLNRRNCLDFMHETTLEDLEDNWPEFDRWFDDYIVYLDQGQISPRMSLSHEVCERSEAGVHESPIREMDAL